MPQIKAAVWSTGLTLCNQIPFLTVLTILQDNGSGSQQAALDIKAMRKAIAAGFALTDQQVLAQAQQQQWVDGAVCVAVWLIQETAFVANVGLMHHNLFALKVACHCLCYHCLV